MVAFESDWVFLRDALPLLGEYILSQEVYWAMRQPARSPSGLQTPQLTIGNVRLSLARLSAVPLDEKARAELESLGQRIGQVREEWRTNWGNKAAKEYESRLSLWQQYVRELQADPRGQAAAYANAVRQRVILRLLVDEVYGDLPAAQTEELARLDQALRGVSRPGPFVWEPEVQPSFPAGDFWFLYLSL